MARQLHSWQAFLPAVLQWSDDDIFSDADLDPIDEGDADTVGLLFGRELGPDLLNAELRTRFYYAHFILYRPFSFKALHLPHLMSAHDAQYCALAIRAACTWPVTLAPARERKRLIPHLFTWTQSFTGILLILWMSRNNE